MDVGPHYRNFSTPGDPHGIAEALAVAAKTAEQAGLAEPPARASGLGRKHECPGCVPTLQHARETPHLRTSSRQPLANETGLRDRLLRAVLDLCPNVLNATEF